MKLKSEIDREIEKILQELVLLWQDNKVTNNGGIGDAKNKLKTLFDKTIRELVGEMEKPDEYIAKHITEIELNTVFEAVKFHARNELRQQILTNLEK